MSSLEQDFEFGRIFLEAACHDPGKAGCVLRKANRKGQNPALSPCFPSPLWSDSSEQHPLTLPAPPGHSRATRLQKPQPPCSSMDFSKGSRCYLTRPPDSFFHDERGGSRKPNLM